MKSNAMFVAYISGWLLQIMDLGNVNHDAEEVAESDPVTAAAAASISINPPPPTTKPPKQQQQHIITTYAKPVPASSHLTTLNAVQSTGGFSVVPSSSSSSSKTIVVVPAGSNNNPASGDASQPVLKKIKLGWAPHLLPPHYLLPLLPWTIWILYHYSHMQCCT